MQTSAKVIPLRPRRLTKAEQLIERVREGILTTNMTRKQLALKCHVSATTVGNLAIGKTRWPRPTTLFPIVEALGMELKLVQKGEE